MHWGLIPHWAADPSIGNRMINASAETLTGLPSFKLLVDRHRCIIPADGFYKRVGLGSDMTLVIREESAVTGIYLAA